MSGPWLGSVFCIVLVVFSLDTGEENFNSASQNLGWKERGNLCKGLNRFYERVIWFQGYFYHYLNITNMKIEFDPLVTYTKGSIFVRIFVNLVPCASWNLFGRGALDLVFKIETPEFRDFEFKSHSISLFFLNLTSFLSKKKRERNYIYFLSRANPTMDLPHNKGIIHLKSRILLWDIVWIGSYLK